MHRLMRPLRGAAVAALFPVTTLAAQAAARPAADSQPLSPAMELVRQGRRLSNQGQQDEAIATFGKAVALEPKLSEAHAGIGIALDLQGKYAEARHHLQEAIDFAPDSTRDRARRTMAVSYAFESKADDAMRFEKPVFDAALAAGRFFDAGEVADEQARIYLESGNLDSALAWYRRGYETGLKEPGISAARKDLWEFRWHHAEARIAARRGQASEAQRHVAMAKAVLDRGTNPQQAVFLPYLTGYVAFYTGDLKTAIADLRKGNQKDPFILCLLAQADEKSGGVTPPGRRPSGGRFWRSTPTPRPTPSRARSRASACTTSIRASRINPTEAWRTPR
jgi:tetratricopeptide (TPR) repeat protein